MVFIIIDEGSRIVDRTINSVILKSVKINVLVCERNIRIGMLHGTGIEIELFYIFINIVINTGVRSLFED